jgi:hypothetical protein
MLSAKKRLWIEILLHIVFWIGVFYTLTSLNSSHIHVKAKTRFAFNDQYDDRSISSYVYLTLFFLAVLFYGNILWVFKKIIRYKKGIVRLAIGASWFMLVFSANYFIVGPFFDNANHAVEPPPLPRFQKPEFRSLSVPHIRRDPITPPQVDVVNFMVSSWRYMQPIMLLAFLAILGVSIAYFFLKEWAKSELIQSRLQAYQLSTEIKFLKSQINPHFLFNTLNNLFSMAQGKGNDELADGILKLSGMMRYMIYESNEETVPLQKEIDYLQNCIVLNKLRYADAEVKVVFHWPEETGDIFVAPMLFIPFVENAFKHGVSIGASSPINISILLTGKQLHFSCANTNYSFIKKMEVGKSGIGLENVKRRLDLVYPGKHKLTIDNADGEFIVNLEIDI